MGFKKVVAKLCLACCAAALPLVPTMANDIWGDGSAVIDNTGGANLTQTVKKVTLGIQGNGNTITWDKLNVPKGKQLDFNFSAAGQVALNKVLTGVSTFSGAVTSSGQAGHVVISNPNGIVVANGAVFNMVGGLTMTTHDATWDGQLKGKISTTAVENGGVGVSNGILMNNANVVSVGTMNIISTGIRMNGTRLASGDRVKLYSSDGVNFYATNTQADARPVTFSSSAQSLMGNPEKVLYNGEADVSENSGQNIYMNNVTVGKKKGATNGYLTLDVKNGASASYEGNVRLSRVKSGGLLADGIKANLRIDSGSVIKSNAYEWTNALAGNTAANRILLNVADGSTLTVDNSIIEFGELYNNDINISNRAKIVDSYIKGNQISILGSTVTKTSRTNAMIGSILPGTIIGSNPAGTPSKIEIIDSIISSGAKTPITVSALGDSAEIILNSSRTGYARVEVDGIDSSIVVKSDALTAKGVTIASNIANSTLKAGGDDSKITIDSSNLKKQTLIKNSIIENSAIGSGALISAYGSNLAGVQFFSGDEANIIIDSSKLTAPYILSEGGSVTLNNMILSGVKKGELASIYADTVNITNSRLQSKAGIHAANVNILNSDVISSNIWIGRLGAQDDSAIDGLYAENSYFSNSTMHVFGSGTATVTGVPELRTITEVDKDGVRTQKDVWVITNQEGVATREVNIIGNKIDAKGRVVVNKGLTVNIFGSGIVSTFKGVFDKMNVNLSEESIVVNSENVARTNKIIFDGSNIKNSKITAGSIIPDVIDANIPDRDIKMNGRSSEIIFKDSAILNTTVKTAKNAPTASISAESSTLTNSKFNTLGDKSPINVTGSNIVKSTFTTQESGSSIGISGSDISTSTLTTSGNESRIDITNGNVLNSTLTTNGDGASIYVGDCISKNLTASTFGKGIAPKVDTTLEVTEHSTSSSADGKLIRDIKITGSGNLVITWLVENVKGGVPVPIKDRDGNDIIKDGKPVTHIEFTEIIPSNRVIEYLNGTIAGVAEPVAEGGTPTEPKPVDAVLIKDGRTWYYSPHTKIVTEDKIVDYNDTSYPFPPSGTPFDSKGYDKVEIWGTSANSSITIDGGVLNGKTNLSISGGGVSYPSSYGFVPLDGGGYREDVREDYVSNSVRLNDLLSTDLKYNTLKISSPEEITIDGANYTGNINIVGSNDTQIQISGYSTWDYQGDFFDNIYRNGRTTDYTTHYYMSLSSGAEGSPQKQRFDEDRDYISTLDTLNAGGYYAPSQIKGNIKLDLTASGAGTRKAYLGMYSTNLIGNLYLSDMLVSADVIYSSVNNVIVNDVKFNELASYFEFTAAEKENGKWGQWTVVRHGDSELDNKVMFTFYRSLGRVNGSIPKMPGYNIFR